MQGFSRAHVRAIETSNAARGAQCLRMLAAAGSLPLARRLCIAGSTPPETGAAAPSSHWPPPSAWVGSDTAVRVCSSRTCRQQGSKKVLEYVSSVVKPAGVGVVSSGCLGRCGDGPNLVFTPSGTEGNRMETKLAVLEAILRNCSWRGAELSEAPAEE